jgi:hypothetical protein
MPLAEQRQEFTSYTGCHGKRSRRCNRVTTIIESELFIGPYEKVHSRGARVSSGHQFVGCGLR